MTTLEVLLWINGWLAASIYYTLIDRITQIERYQIQPSGLFLASLIILLFPFWWVTPLVFMAGWLEKILIRGTTKLAELIS